MIMNRHRTTARQMWHIGPAYDQQSTVLADLPVPMDLRLQFGLQFSAVWGPSRKDRSTTPVQPEPIRMMAPRAANAVGSMAPASSFPILPIAGSGEACRASSVPLTGNEGPLTVTRGYPRLQVSSHSSPDRHRFPS